MAMATESVEVDLTSRAARGVADALASSSLDVQTAISRHRWVHALADGTLPDAALINWAGQCRLFCLMERPALLILRSYVQPGELDDLLAKLVEDTVREPRELAQLLVDLGAPVPEQPWRTCLGYGSYVQAAAHGGVLKGLAAILAVERTYLETWTALLPSCPPASRYRHWVENWSCEDFRTVVGALGDCLDRLAGAPFEPVLEELKPIYRNVALWEFDFWEMCWNGDSWPELEDQS
jgi:thiaminase/transcriptional activator TenA